MSANTSIYLHIPFCTHRCSYCDFNTYAGKELAIPAYVDALCQEIRLFSRSAPEPIPVHTFFFGGGTPSLLSGEQLIKIMKTLREAFEVQPGYEATLEANPGTLSPQFLNELRTAGINRLSLGVQSAHPADLQLLERQHDFIKVIRSVEWARRAGFANLNLDLIFGIPHQSLDRWKETLDLVLGLHPEHLSLYALTLEHGTPFQRWTEHGLIPEADPDLAADMYEWAMQRLDNAGYAQYEISNWAKLDGVGEMFSCRHNLQYWYNEPYIGFGAGAHGYIGGYRTANVLGIHQYIKHLKTSNHWPYPITPANVTARPMDRKTEMQETMMVGMRLTREGVSAGRFEKRFGVTIESVFPSEIRRLLALELIEWVEDGERRLRLTPRGRLLGNQVFMEFVGE